MLANSLLIFYATLHILTHQRFNSVYVFDMILSPQINVLRFLGPTLKSFQAHSGEMVTYNKDHKRGFSFSSEALTSRLPHKIQIIKIELPPITSEISSQSGIRTTIHRNTLEGTNETHRGTRLDFWENI